MKKTQTGLGGLQMTDHVENFYSYAEKFQYTEGVTAAIHALLDMSDKARHQGLLAMEDSLDMGLYRKRDLFHTMLKLIIDGTDACVISDMCKYLYKTKREEIDSNHGHYKYYNLIDNIIFEGMLSIQAGDNPKILLQKVVCMVPNSMYDEALICYEPDGCDFENNQYQRIRGMEEEAKKVDFGQTYFLSDTIIQLALRSIETSVLANAIHFAPDIIQNVWLSNMSRRAADMCMDCMAEFDDKWTRSENIIASKNAQSTILEICERVLNDQIDKLNKMHKNFMEMKV
jgi:hypothetical protein